MVSKGFDNNNNSYGMRKIVNWFFLAFRLCGFISRKVSLLKWVEVVEEVEGVVERVELDFIPWRIGVGMRIIIA
jgi:hypothetical protein